MGKSSRWFPTEGDIVVESGYSVHRTEEYNNISFMIHVIAFMELSLIINRTFFPSEQIDVPESESHVSRNNSLQCRNLYPKEQFPGDGLRFRRALSMPSVYHRQL